MKKIKVFLLAAIVSLILLYVIFSHAFSPFIDVIILFVIYYAGTFWILDYDVDVLGLFTLMLFPAVMLSIVGLSVVTYISKLYTITGSLPLMLQHIFVVIFVFAIIVLSSYAAVISMNIFNVARYKRLPLLQAAQTIVYMYSVIGSYLGFTLIQHFFLPNWYVVLPLYIIFSGFLIFINNWTSKFTLQENMMYTIIGMFIIIQFAAALSFFPLISYAFPITITVILYLYNGIMTHLNKRNLLQRITYEYITLLSIVLILILITSHWGVAGNIVGL